MIPTYPVLLLLAPFVVLAAACGGRQSDQAVGTLDQAALDEFLSGANAENSYVFDDGKVTFEEYEASVLRAVSCVTDLGIEVEGPVPGPRRTLNIKYAVPDSEPGLFDNAEACTGAELAVWDAWSWENRPSEQEIQDAREALVNCLQEADVQVSDNPTGDELQRLTVIGGSPWRACVKAVQEEYELPGFVG